MLKYVTIQKKYNAVQLEKVYDRVVLHEEVWSVVKYVKVQDMYEDSRTVLCVGVTDGFKVGMGSALGTFLLAVMMGRLADEVREESL